MGHQSTEGSPTPNPGRSLSYSVKRMARISKRSKGRSVTSVTDATSFAFSFELASELLLQGQPCCSPQSVGGLRRLMNGVLRSGRLLRFVEDCSSLRFELVQSGSLECVPSKVLLRRGVRGLVSTITSVIPSSLIVHPSPHFDRVVTFLGWFKRLPIEIRDTRESIDAYYQCDRRLSLVNYDDNQYVPQLREIWLEWFGDFALSFPFAPQHGSGSTADAGRIRADKWRLLSVDRVAHVCLRYPNLQNVVDLPIRASSRCSKLVFVPKQAGKDRAICMEPAWLQFLQQGIQRQLVAYTHDKRHPLHRMVDIFSQENNRTLCANAQYRGLATLDLSDASDSVSWHLVSKLTAGTPLHRYLYATRSTTTLIDGRRVKMVKFAPMGSALCFPIECYVFASIVELAYRLHYGQASRGHLSGCSVYGDDIIVPAELNQLVVEILTSLGFVVNVSKSFDSGRYYESCGVEYCDGVMINTVKHPRDHLYCQEVTSPERVGMITNLANSLYEQGYFQCRRKLLKSYEGVNVRIGNRVRPFMDLMRFDREHCIPVGIPYVRQTWDPNIQSRVVRYWSCDIAQSSSAFDYQQWQSNNYRRSRGERIRDLYPDMSNIQVEPRFGRKAVVCLSKFGYLDLLQGRDIQDVGPCRTGRLRQRFRYHTG